MFFNEDSNAMNEASVEKFLESRREEGLDIEPESAQIHWQYAYTLDPYGIFEELPADLRQIGREYFARNSESDEWVSFRDIPAETVSKLMQRYHQEN